MKRSFNVNLGGVTFRFDEDALELLERFIEKVTDHFKGRGEELKVAEVEQAVASKLKALVGVDGIVTIELVRSVLDEAGLPFGAAHCEARPVSEPQTKSQHEQPKEDAEKSSSEADEAPWRAAMLLGKKLFRDPYDQFIGGVLAGVAKYCGWSVALTRVIYLLFFVASFSLGGSLAFLLLLFYCLAWAIIPKARSIMDITRMRKPVAEEYSAAALESAWRNNYNIAMAELASPKTNGCLATVVKILFFAVLLLVGLPVLFALAIVLFVFLVALFAFCAILGGAIFSNIYVIILLTLPLFALVHWILKKSGVCRPLNIYIKLTIIIGWLLTLVLACHKIYTIVEENGGWENIRQHIIDGRYFDEDYWEDIIRKNIEQAQSARYVAWDDENLPFAIDAKMVTNGADDDRVSLRFIGRDLWRRGSGDTRNREFDTSSLDISLLGDSVGNIRFVWDSLENELLVGLDATIGASMELNSTTDGVQLRYMMPSDSVQYGNAAQKGKFPFEIMFPVNGNPRLYIGGNDTIAGLLVNPVASQYSVHSRIRVDITDEDEEEDEEFFEPSDTL